jgi:hypothetical protein
MVSVLMSVSVDKIRIKPIYLRRQKQRLLALLTNGSHNADVDVEAIIEILLDCPSLGRTPTYSLVVRTRNPW